MKATTEAETQPGFCQCGKPLHYTMPFLRDVVQELIKQTNDEFITISFLGGQGQVYRVQRHFLALHGFSLKTAREFGFEPITQ